MQRGHDARNNMVLPPDPLAKMRFEVTKVAVLECKKKSRLVF